jgi:glycerophosphoryl diester phosphodiesterase
MNPPLIIGHRGYAARFPDNSVAGASAALAAGADGIEVDVRRSGGGTWVCHHDRSRGGRPIREWTDGGLAGENVASLAEIVDLVPADRQLFVEVKPLPARDLVEGLEALEALLRPRLAGTRVISSSPGVLRALQRAIPGLGTALVFDKIPESVPEGVELSPAHRLVERLLPAGVPLHPWTVNRPRRMVELARLGVASITTNDPGLAVEVLGG